MQFSKPWSAQHYLLPECAIPIDATIHQSWLQITLPRPSPNRRRLSTSRLSTATCVRRSDTFPPQSSDAVTPASWDSIILDRKHDVQVSGVTGLLNSLSKLYLVSDGSLVEYRGGYASVFATEDDIISTAYGATPLVGQLNTSFRTEAYGMLSGLTMLLRIIKEHKITIHTMRVVTVFSDSESLITSIVKFRRNHMTIKSYYGPDVDVIVQILALTSQLSDLNIHLLWEHVKGHQDGVVSTVPLTREAVLNIEADRLAGLHMDLPVPPYYE